ncbi:MAG: phosphonoacetaldehyde hydrolase [Butyricicoccus sp.]|nr:phosphonoacetaldehyde hydrolase [Butyricicoccus sp.]
MAKIEAIILDWAGTTVDYGSFAPVRAFQEVFRQYGLEPTMEETRAPMGMLKIDHIRTMLQMPRLTAEWKRVHGRLFTERDVQAMHDIFAAKLMTILHEFAAPKPYVLDTVAKLRAQGYKIGSTTGYTDAMMSIVVPEAAGRGYAPDCWFSPDSTNGKGRPYPYMIFRNLMALGVSSVRAAVKIGDTASDIREGVNAGVWTVGVLEGSSAVGVTMEEYDAMDELAREDVLRKAEKLYRDNGADFVILNLSELPGVLAQIENR